MIQRINLIEKQALSFTYQRLLQICMVVVLINALLVGVQFLRIYRLEPQIQAARDELAAEEATHTELTKQPQQKRKKKTADAGQYQKLYDAVDALPKWSKLLRVISTNLPNSVWLANFKSLGLIAPPPTDPKDPKQQQVVVPSGMRVEITGTGSDIKAIAEFTAALEKTPEFANLVLVNTQKSETSYQYTLQGEVGGDYVK